jgi:hypothetical protein
MDETDKLEDELTSFTHGIFLENEYINWRLNLARLTDGKWHSLISNLSEHGAPINSLKDFGEAIYSKLVFNCVKAPDFRTSRQVMVSFTISGGLWHSVIWHCPENN